MATNVYSKRLGAVSDEQLQRAVTYFGLGKLVRAEAIPYGLFAQNLFLTTTQGDYVLRGAPHYPWQLRTEQYFAEQIHKYTNVPIPFPYLVDTTNQIFSWSGGYAIMPRMPGEYLAYPPRFHSLSMEELHQVAYAMATLLWRMQQLTSDYPGRYDPETRTIAHFQGGYVRRTIERIADLFDRAEQSKAHVPEDVEWIKSLVHELESVPEPTQVTIVMEDFSYGNMTFQRTSDERWEVIGLFDLMTCHFGDGLADLPRQFSLFLDADPSGALAQAFLQSYYRQNKGLSVSELALKGRLYLTDERLLVWEYFRRSENRGGPREDDESLLIWLAKYFNAWNKSVSALC